MFGGERRMHKRKIDLHHKVNISRLYSTYDDATTSLTEHIYCYILHGGLLVITLEPKSVKSVQ